MRDELLKRLHGTSSIEELTFDRTRLSRDDLAHVAAFPHLKSLSFDQRALDGADATELAGHPELGTTGYPKRHGQQGSDRAFQEECPTSASYPSD